MYTLLESAGVKLFFACSKKHDVWTQCRMAYIQGDLGEFHHTCTSGAGEFPESKLVPDSRKVGWVGVPIYAQLMGKWNSPSLPHDYVKYQPSVLIISVIHLDHKTASSKYIQSNFSPNLINPWVPFIELKTDMTWLAQKLFKKAKRDWWTSLSAVRTLESQTTCQDHN